MRDTALRLLRQPLFATLLLTALVARSLIPAGYMPGAGGLVVCSGFTATPASSAAEQFRSMAGMDMHGMDMHGMDMSGMPEHDGAGGGHAGTDSEQAGAAGHSAASLCPFAAAGTGAALACAAIAGPQWTALAATKVPELAGIAPRQEILDPAHSPRGPPTFIS